MLVIEMYNASVEREIKIDLESHSLIHVRVKPVIPSVVGCEGGFIHVYLPGCFFLTVLVRTSAVTSSSA